MMMFNVEEQNLLALFHTGSRKDTINDFKMMLDHIGDKELEEVCRHVLDKLSKMSDEEYAALDLEVDEGFEYGE